MTRFFKKNFNFKNTESYKYVVEAGEKSKNITQYYKMIRFLTSINVDRNDLIIVLGGGVVGDLAGFIASTYMRGIDYIQVPTSLLAMVDSSIGSKTAINTEDGKNLIGSFYAHKAVFIDLDFLKTLPQEEFTNGLAEIIKCSIIKDKNLFDLINEEEIYDRNTLSNIIKMKLLTLQVLRLKISMKMWTLILLVNLILEL
ncbi:3-dehydroquinate synthase family protein [Anaerococcus sp.]|uniref:3-dehydroquinate synthase n=2 Tax=Anaerococcus TaxID=165779 RepID=UPI002901876E|nr:3-dehydroquinate synthase family protein [Anaerococcus sp.]MDU3212296.1 3-dehydroquinate synthase family protein [Anaerococcus sp.]